MQAPNTQMQIVIPFEKIKEICERYHVYRMTFFGSVLRGDFNEDSDIDILIDFDSKAEIGYIMFYTLQQELSDLLGYPVDLIPRSGLRPIIWERIKDKSQVIYEQQTPA